MTQPLGNQSGDRQFVGVSQASYKGPLPLPVHLEHYEKIIPGAAERILKMAEKQATQRQGLEKWVVRTNSIASILGVCFAFIIVIVCLFFAKEVLSQGQTAEGVFLIFSSIGTIAGLFVYSKEATIRERASRENRGQ
jgi:uncharacterized membrane protein